MRAICTRCEADNPDVRENNYRCVNCSRQQMCADLLVGAIEGGTGYWASVSEYNIIPEYEANAVIHVEDEPDEKPHLITWETMDRGLKLIVKGDEKIKINVDMRRDIRVLDASDGYERFAESVDWDADICDVILQVALFGEIVYG